MIDVQRARIKELEACGQAQIERIKELESEDKEKDERIKELEARGAAKDGRIAELEEQDRVKSERIVEFERRLGLNSTNSGKPPATDGLGKKPPVHTSVRGKAKNPTGGQAGHPGETLRQTDAPDRVVDYFPPVCAGCGDALSREFACETVERQVFDIPEPKMEVTAHRAHGCVCPGCGVTTRASFPEGVTAPVQYGARAIAVARYLQIQQFIPEDRTSQAMHDLFGLSMSASSVAKFVSQCASLFTGFMDHVHGLVLQAGVKHLDETGMRVGAKLHWLHVMSTTALTHYRVEEKRGAMPKGVSGIIVHDHFKPYYTIPDVLHALCNQHHLRELQSLIDFDGEPWAPKMQRLLRRGCHAVNLAHRKGVALAPAFIELFNRRYDAILAEAIEFHQAQEPLTANTVRKRGRIKRRKGHNLAIRLRDFKTDVIRFLSDPNVPFTNNQAEQDVRMAKVRQKISGCFRTLQGAKDFAINRSLVSTARKQGWSIIQTLMDQSDQLIQKLNPHPLRV
jgi:transposase